MRTVGVAVAMAHADSAGAKPLAMSPPAATLSVCSVFWPSQPLNDTHFAAI
jgi:hypothetical protein